MGRYEALGGRVVFYTRPSCLQTSLDWQKLDKLIEGIEHSIKVDAPGAVTDLIYLVASTERIEFVFQGNETALLTEFRAAWEDVRPFTVEGVKTALNWRLNGSRDILNAWEKAIEDSNKLWVDPVDAPLEQLPSAQQAEASDPDSFLADSAPNGSTRTKTSASTR